jgi:hypothetical protein
MSGYQYPTSASNGTTNSLSDADMFLIYRRLQEEKTMKASSKNEARIIDDRTIMFKPVPACPVWIKMEWLPLDHMLLISMGFATWKNPPLPIPIKITTSQAEMKNLYHNTKKRQFV